MEWENIIPSVLFASVVEKHTGLLEWCRGGSRIQTELEYCAGLEEEVRRQCPATVVPALPFPTAPGYRSITGRRPATGTTHRYNTFSKNS